MSLVSICCITYNHEKFIKECLDGFLMQKTKFPVEVLIHDDASTDSTADIIKEYEALYPHIIKPIYQTENQYSKGKKINISYNFPRARGKYIALCEGDDYWYDPNKLQNQVDLMESNPDCVICFHKVLWREEKTGKSQETYFGCPDIKPYYTIDDLLEYSNFIPTASAVFRNHFIKSFPNWFDSCPVGDYPLHVLNLLKCEGGKVGFIDETMAVYRRHSGGLYGGRKNYINAETTIKVHNLIGKELRFQGRLSWKKGMSRQYVQLYEYYLGERKWLCAFKAAIKSFNYTPMFSLKALVVLNTAMLRRFLFSTYKSIQLWAKK